MYILWCVSQKIQVFFTVWKDKQFENGTYMYAIKCFFGLLKHLSWQQEIRWVQISINIFKITNYLGEKSPFDKTSLKTGTADLNHYRCVERFTSGCPTTPYTDDEIYTRRSIFCSRHIIQSNGIWIKSKHFPGKKHRFKHTLGFFYSRRLHLKLAQWSWSFLYNIDLL